jgi:hypothetical protein
MSKEKYRRIIKNMLSSKQHISEGRIKYSDDIKERILPELEEELRNRAHSLGTHPIFPESDEYHFEEKIIGDRFDEVVRNVKRHYDKNEIDNNEILSETLTNINECQKIEKKHKKELEELVLNLIKDEFDIPEDEIEFDIELTPNINLNGTKLNATPTILDDVEFESHDELMNANKEVYKRRFINAMNQGCGMSTNHMFHMVDEDLLKLDPTLLNKYNKLMSGVNYLQFAVDNITNTQKINGGISQVVLPKTEDDDTKPKIIVKAITFPVLIHELTKGVMELLAANGLPNNNNIRKYVLGKADFLNAELWDMRLGPAIWKKFMNCIPKENYKLKHYLFADIVSLPVDEFNDIMREIMINSKRAKDTIIGMVNNIEKELQKESFEEELEQKREFTKKNNGYIDNPDELDEYWDNLGLYP